MKNCYVTTGKCADGTYHGAAWRSDNTLIDISDAAPTRSKARTWAKNAVKRAEVAA